MKLDSKSKLDGRKQNYWVSKAHKQEYSGVAKKRCSSQATYIANANGCHNMDLTDESHCETITRLGGIPRCQHQLGMGGHSLNLCYFWQISWHQLGQPIVDKITAKLNKGNPDNIHINWLEYAVAVIDYSTATIVLAQELSY
jgi:hypothetical protein